jgi:hypothetical protein
MQRLVNPCIVHEEIAIRLEIMIYRRNLLKHFVTGAAALSCCIAAPNAVSAVFVSNMRLSLLPVFLDTLIPEDSTSSASQLGIHEQLIRHARDIQNYTRLLELGCEWLDGQANALYGKGFINLGMNQRIRVVKIAEATEKHWMQRVFFDRVRQDVFSFYYSQPVSWTGLIITVPPQPFGYARYDKPL